MTIFINSAIQAQISTLPVADQTRIASVLHQLENTPRRIPENVHRLIGQNDLWSARITRNLRAIFRITDDDIYLLAIARPQQVDHYLRNELADADSRRHHS
jgi:Txe/YoeB family toxin of Txe-Axe toxin-antitoxin module